jgi:hypothetical protein
MKLKLSKSCLSLRGDIVRFEMGHFFGCVNFETFDFFLSKSFKTMHVPIATDASEEVTPRLPEMAWTVNVLQMKIGPSLSVLSTIWMKHSHNLSSIVSLAISVKLEKNNFVLSNRVNKNLSRSFWRSLLLG